MLVASRSAWGLVVTLLGSSACASAPARTEHAASKPPAQTARPSSGDSALQLAMRLPTGADHCAVARPYRIDDRQKVLATSVMQSDALAWEPSLAVTAFASAGYTRADGPSAQVMWLRSALPASELKRRLEARLEIAWSQGPCEAAPCPIRGEVVEGMVRLSREPWPVGLAPGAEAHCVRAAHDPRVLDLSAARLRRMPLGDLLGLPLRSTSSVQLASDALVVERAEIMVGRAEAGERAMRARGSARERAFGLAASDVRVEQEDVLVRTTARYLWDDLAMLARDAQALASAERAAKARASQPAPAVDGPLPPGDYLARAAHLLHQLNNALAHERDARRSELHVLLERGLAEYPEHESIALLLFELRMADGERRDSARELAERFAALPGSDPRWQDALKALR